MLEGCWLERELWISDSRRLSLAGPEGMLLLLMLALLGPVGIEGSVGRRYDVGVLAEAVWALRGPVGVSGMAWPLGANL